ncbi:MAG: vWA domain-containing protein [Marvinbryantia sp.]|uniref:vWA domain-containing protein n=1 Tax=Marvinbryantia sp. TaxID=2496532 RepID=UPI00399AA1D1
MKKIWAAIMGLIFTAIMSLTGIPVMAQEESVENHFVIMLDTSGSMKNIDSQRQTGDMIMRFINKMPLASYPAKLSVMLFDTETRDCLVEDGNPWYYLPDGSKGNQMIKNALGEIEYEGGYTDIRKALAHGMDVLQQMREGVSECRQTVLFITDGFLDVAGDGQNSNLTNICSAYEEMIKLAEQFPEDCCFMGIIPEIESVPKSVAVFSEEGEKTVINYSETPVNGEEMQKYLMKVVNGVEEFSNILESRNPPTQTYRSKTEKIRLDDPGRSAMELIDEQYEAFFGALFHAKTKEIKTEDLADGVDVTIPEIVGEVNIAIVPDGASQEEILQKITKLTQDDGVRIKTGDSEVGFLMEYTDTSVNLKITDPQSGEYTLSSAEEIKGTVTLKFTSYGELKLQCEEVSTEHVLGDTLQIKGKLTGPNGEAVSDDCMKHVKLSVTEAGSDRELAITDVEGSSFTAEYPLNRTGAYYLTVKWEYSDLTSEESVGITDCWDWGETIYVEVPEVEYALKEVPEKSICYENVPFVLKPYSIAAEKTLAVRAEDCEQFLEDSWIVRINGEEAGRAAADTQRGGFYFDKKFTEEGNYTVEFYNERSGQSLSTEISVAYVPLQLEVPEEGALGNEIEIVVKHPQEISEADQCEITVTDENQEICQQKTVSFEEGRAGVSFRPEKEGNYYVTAQAGSMEQVSGEIQIVNHAPEKTADMPERLIIPCMLYKSCGTEVDVGTWFTDPDSHSWTVQFSENEYFEPDSSAVNSEGGTQVRIGRKTERRIHLPQTAELSYTIVDEYGKTGVSGTLLIEEKIAGEIKWGVLLLAAVVIFVFWGSRKIYRDQRIPVTIHYGGGSFTRWILQREGKRKVIRRHWRKLAIVWFEDGNILYEYQGQTGMADQFMNIYLR